MSACGIVGGIVVSRHPATPGTDSANDLGREPADVQEPQQRPQLRDLPLRRPEAHPVALAQQEPDTTAPSRPATPSSSAGVTRAVRNRRASVSYRSTVIAANPRSAISHSPVLVDERLDRRQRRRLLGDHHPDLAEIGQHRAQRPNGRDPPTHQQHARPPGTTRSRRRSERRSRHPRHPSSDPDRPGPSTSPGRSAAYTPPPTTTPGSPPRTAQAAPAFCEYPTSSASWPRPRPRRSKWLVGTRNYADKPAGATNEKPSEHTAFRPAATTMSA